MDANKLQKLREIKYLIRKCCGVCSHAQFPVNDWSICDLYRYQHQKHSDSMRNLSVNAYGRCNSFEWSQEYLDQLDTWFGFLEE